MTLTSSPDFAFLALAYGVTWTVLCFYAASLWRRVSRDDD